MSDAKIEPAMLALAAANGVTHSMQNLAPGRFSVPQ
jgi:hypothetical protein